MVLATKNNDDEDDGSVANGDNVDDIKTTKFMRKMMATNAMTMMVTIEMMTTINGDDTDAHKDDGDKGEI